MPVKAERHLRRPVIRPRAPVENDRIGEFRNVVAVEVPVAVLRLQVFETQKVPPFVIRHHGLLTSCRGFTPFLVLSVCRRGFLTPTGVSHAQTQPVAGQGDTDSRVGRDPYPESGSGVQLYAVEGGQPGRTVSVPVYHHCTRWMRCLGPPRILKMALRTR